MFAFCSSQTYGESGQADAPAPKLISKVTPTFPSRHFSTSPRQPRHRVPGVDRLTVLVQRNSHAREVDKVDQ